MHDRNVAMVYQQFINYPAMTVRDNIASPLKLRGESHHRPRVRELAGCHIDIFLRPPARRTVGRPAAAPRRWRALVKTRR